MTRLAISAIEMEVTKKEVMDLMKSYESQGVIPDNQKVQRVIDRAWYVASSDLDAHEANDKFRSEKIDVDAPLSLEAGLNLTKFETKITKEGLKTDFQFSSKVKVKRLKQT